MAQDEIARAVLEALGGTPNIQSHTVCMTRLRITLKDPSAVNYDGLAEVPGVLGTATRGGNGLEVVFGPQKIETVYQSFVRLTGIAASSDPLFPMGRQDSNLRVQIRAGRQAQESPANKPAESLINESELSLLEDIFGAGFAQDEPQTEAARPDARLVVINGPNINMLGVASPSSEDYPSLLELCKQTARLVGFSRCDCYQSNHEGDLVDAVQDALEGYDAIVINPTAYGNSVALRDAIRAVALPALEVHRHHMPDADEVGGACIQAVCGRGNDGYRMAIEAIAAHLGL